MPLASVTDLLDALRSLPLLEPGQLDELTHQLAARFPEPRALAGELVRRGWLTPYQVNQLFQGKGRALVLGSYVLLERIGEGGMGQVFKAKNWKLGRIVALKLIRKERLADEDAVRRFHREIRAAAQLSHPNIVLAYDADEDAGTHFFAMEYVEGIDLARLVKKQGPLPAATACDYVRQAALGLQHAHEKGMVHRDVKPHNLLLAHGRQVKVLDMGLARVAAVVGDEQASSTLTQEGAVMGTPDYIAPEQALDSRTADIRADLYSLGCTLYFLLTGRVPFPGGTALEKLMRHQSQPPPAVLAVRPDVPPPVAAVVARLLSKRPQDRYQTPAELSAALTAALAPGARVATVPVPSAPVPAPAAPAPGDTFADLRRDTVDDGDGGRGRREAARRKRLWIYGSAGAGALALLILLVVLLSGGKKKPEATPEDKPPTPATPAARAAAEKEWQALAARAEDAAADRAKLRRDVLAFRLAHPDMPQAVRAAELLMRLPSPLDVLDAAELRPIQKRAGQPKELVAVIGHYRGWCGSPFFATVTYSPDGSRLACNAADDTIHLFDAQTLRLMARLKEPWPATMADFRHDSKAVVTAGHGGVGLWDLSGARPRQVRQLKGFPARVSCVRYRPDGKALAVACDGTKPVVRLYDLGGAVPKEYAVLEGHTGGIRDVAFAPDGKTLVSCSGDKTIRVYDLSGAEPKLRAVLHHEYWVVSVAFSPDGKLLASSGQHDCTVRLWDMTVPEPKQLAGPWLGEAPNKVAFSPDGKLLAAAFWDHTVHIWDVSARTLKPYAVLVDQADMVQEVAFSPDGKTLATTGNLGRVHLWNVAFHPPRQRPLGPGHMQPVTALAFSPDGATLASMSQDRTARVWEVSGRSLRQRPAMAMPAGFVCGAFTPDGVTLATGDAKNKVVFWDPTTGREQRTLPAHDKGVLALAFSPDSRALVTGGWDQTMKFWETAGGELRRAERLDQGVNALAWSPDGQTAAVAGVTGLLQLWDTRSHRLRASCPGPAEAVWTVAFSPDGKLLAAGGKDGRVRLYDAATGRERASMPGHTKPVRFVAFTPDGKDLISAGLDGQVIVREPGTGKERLTMQVPGGILAGALACDGRHLATGHADGNIYVLRLVPSSSR